MAHGRKTGGKNFEPGNQLGVLNRGKPKLSPEMKAIRKLTSVEFERIANKLLFLTMDELSDLEDDNSISMIEHLVIAIIRAGIKGDPQKLGFLLDRMIGKSLERVEHTGHLSLASLVAQSRQEIESEVDES